MSLCADELISVSLALTQVIVYDYTTRKKRFLAGKF